jgi:hypothetical protein
MTDLEFILEHLGENKVTLNINVNEFIETAEHVKSINKYALLPNLIEVYKAGAGAGAPKPVFTDTDKILIACIKYIDESLTLVSSHTLQSKLDLFKKELVLYTCNKKLGIIKTAAMFLKINIATVDNLYECGDLKIDDTLYITDENTWQVLPKETCKKHIAQHRWLKKEKLNLDTLLVKELRELAIELYIPITGVNKKPLLKKELKEIIFDYINEYSKSHI